MVKPKKSNHSISNRRVRHDYALKDDLITGIELNGAETRALRNGQGDLSGAYVNIINNELWLINATIIGNNAAPIIDEDKTRSRKLLAKKKEIEELAMAKNKGMTIVPIEILNRGRYVKVRIATAVGKKNYDKRATMKEREQKRKIERFVKNN